MAMLPVEARDPQTYAVIGSGMDVHRELGCGFLEHAYQEALALEFQARGIPFAREVDVPIFYKGARLACCYRADFVCFGEVIVEVKAVKQLTSIERAQVINYLKATGYTVALLINFGAESLEYERIVLSKPQRRRAALDPDKSA
ncbi:MAG TPA: GxxExxY protein [Tepidisphaeraceae bacterium]|jgi:GxxExxY protein